jgi:hypothetical protein
MGNYLTEHGYIPWGKSDVLRKGLLDILNGREQIFHFLKEHYDGLNDDLKSFHHAYIEWKRGDKEIHVGESGTLYRFLQCLAWSQGLDKVFIPEGNLVKRVEEFFLNDPDIINWPLERLLTIEGGTTQRASAVILLGNREKIENPPPEIEMTYKAKAHWESQRSIGKLWIPCYDERILSQAAAFHSLFFHRKAEFRPKQAEDYCFARAFSYITKEEGERLWPKLKTHESSRIEEMEKELKKANMEGYVDSKDHRVVQAIAMYKKIKGIGREGGFSYPSCVSKSWPQFWKFLSDLCNGNIPKII